MVRKSGAADMSQLICKSKGSQSEIGASVGETGHKLARTDPRDQKVFHSEILESFQKMLERNLLTICAVYPPADVWDESIAALAQRRRFLSDSCIEFGRREFIW